MITWMQRHKKWLITTIWISTIAFVGAGFVGWGSYDFGKKGGDVAKVGDTIVKVKDLQNQYNNLYSQYKQMFGEKFNNEMAKNLNLEEAALSNAISNAMLVNYANELGLAVTDNEVATELVKIKSFLKDGKFNKEIYIQVLAQNRKTPIEFEDSIKQDLLIQKVKTLLNKFTTTSSQELKDIQSILFSQDKLSINIIDADKLDLSIKEADLKTYWEKNKSNYLSEVSYIIETTNIKVENDTKKSKTQALKKYLKLKKGELQFDNKKTITESNLPFSQENLTKFKEAEIGKAIKPMLENKEYIIAKILQKVDPKPLSFVDAKELVTVDYKNNQKTILLDQTAQNSLNNFKGKDIGYVSRESINNVTGLSDQEAMDFLNQLFLTTSEKGIIKLKNKSVVYKINASKLAKYDTKKDSVVKSTMSNIKYQAAMNNFITNIKTKYEITKY
ncbi:MAG: peptidylprolyl isomerase [Campylobacteraceae bacterium]|mgnify:CR=1 FL=1|jgi:peptidyl-prolyl cis-trans isomerase D|nr:peptidylprolyl isomerase [Campylobacteraceae bacterium]MBT4030539.1 peptidylprolyl isomerase [Campylobacteraceae bacterium]MBT4179550.1 peptidylprolyl isomerase [Campylobacteraceae bacterium]MBT4572217.1 peptidylprolyl isomerase [Campylobacteraceae bacterium]MBT5982835.1 peptidylprolyl isomerase [Campylobacteraceae bacterium]